MRWRMGTGMARMPPLCHVRSPFSSYIIYGNALAPTQDRVSIEFLRNFLPVGKNLTIPPPISYRQEMGLRLGGEGDKSLSIGVDSGHNIDLTVIRPGGRRRQFFVGV